MRKLIQNIAVLTLTIAFNITVFGQGQTFLSEVWTGEGGEMAVFYRNATDKGSAGYDQFNGWGLINAHASLEKVNYPSYYVKHAPTATPTQTTSTNINVIVANNTDGVAAGQYVADRVQLNWTYVDVLPSQHEIIDWWTLEAKTYRGVSAANPITGVRWMDVTPNVTIGGNAAVFSVYTFAWWIKTNILGQTIVLQ